MPVKVAKATKDLAYQKLRDGLSNKEVSELTGLSLRSVGRMKALQEGKVAMPARNARTSHTSPTASQDEPQTGNDDERTTLDFEDSPDPVETPGVVEAAMKSLKGMLGIGEKTTAQPVLSAKLDAKRQLFVESAAPTVALAFIVCAGWAWGRIGPEYKQLAPDEQVAERIVTPLLRIYARHANFMTDINPDMADAGASLFALVGYVHVSLGIYQEIKREKEEYEQINQSGNPYQRETRPASFEPESGPGNASGRHADVWGRDRANGSINGRNVRNVQDVDIPTLSDKEARQYAALSRLSQLDYQHRARRSGRAS